MQNIIKAKKKESNCPVCLSHKTTVKYPENIDLKTLSFTYQFTPNSNKTFRVMRCENCTHVFCSPLPQNMYKNYESVVDKNYLTQEKNRLASALSVLREIKKYTSKGKLLDVGCATGDFLCVAKKFGYTVEGLELSKWSSKIAKKKGLTVYNNVLEQHAKKYPHSYDVITLWGVIEHFENPMQEMKYINTLLKPNGIVALWTGDIDSITSKLLQRKWWYWQGQHIQYFSHKSLMYLGKKSSFRHLITKMYPMAATYDQMSNSLTRYSFSKYINWIVKLVFLVKPILYLRLPGEMFWIGRKV